MKLFTRNFALTIGVMVLGLFGSRIISAQTSTNYYCRVTAGGDNAMTPATGSLREAIGKHNDPEVTDCSCGISFGADFTGTAAIVLQGPMTLDGTFCPSGSTTIGTWMTGGTHQVVIDATNLEDDECAIMIPGGLDAKHAIQKLHFKVKNRDRVICRPNGANGVTSLLDQSAGVTHASCTDDDADGTIEASECQFQDNEIEVVDETDTPTMCGDKKRSDLCARVLKNPCSLKKGSASSCPNVYHYQALLACQDTEADSDGDGSPNLCEQDNDMDEDGADDIYELDNGLDPTRQDTDGDRFCDGGPMNLCRNGDVITACKGDVSKKKTKNPDYHFICYASDPCPHVRSITPGNFTGSCEVTPGGGGDGDEPDCENQENDFDCDGVTNDDPAECLPFDETFPNPNSCESLRGGAPTQQDDPDLDDDGICNTVAENGMVDLDRGIPCSLFEGKGDNCIGIPNSDQANSDGDEAGDACDSAQSQSSTLQDGDLDGIPNDLEANIYGTDAAKADTDGDGFCDGPIAVNDPATGQPICQAADNCRLVNNPDQADDDQNGKGNVCENDQDGDTWCDGPDDIKKPDSDELVCQGGDACPLVASLDNSCPDAAGSPEAPDSGGCGCRIDGQSTQGDGLAFLMILFPLLILRVVQSRLQAKSIS